jgi:parallel beta-helix repeat protein
MTRNTRIVTLALAAVIAATGLIAFAGDLNPPAGPVSGTMKTLTEVEPRIAINSTNTPGDADSLFRITQPGSYYLTGNITGVAGKRGIEVSFGDVTIDLMGFTLRGVPGSLEGISLPTFTIFLEPSNTTIRNGVISEFGGAGISISGLPGNMLVEHLHVSENGGAGIRVGDDCVIRECTAVENASFGIRATDGCVIESCTAIFNGNDGISTDDGCTITGCAVQSNTNDGISTLSGSMIRNCTARSNTLDGIAVSSSCLVLANTCTLNGNDAGDGAGIHAAGTSNRIEGNNCTDADRGIDVDGGGNFIARNSCSGNTTNWDIVIGNAVAPIVQATTNGAAISGNTYAGSLGSTDPNANFSY